MGLVIFAPTLSFACEKMSRLRTRTHAPPKHLWIHNRLGAHVLFIDPCFYFCQISLTFTLPLLFFFFVFLFLFFCSAFENRLCIGVDAAVASEARSFGFQMEKIIR